MAQITITLFAIVIALFTGSKPMEIVLGLLGLLFVFAVGCFGVFLILQTALFEDVVRRTKDDVDQV